jgi:predicted nucleotidyltransferase
VTGFFAGPVRKQGNVNISGQSICGLSAIRIRNLFRALDKSPSKSCFRDGHYIRVPLLLTEEFIAKELKIKRTAAADLVECLRKQGFLERNSNAPTQLSGQLKCASAMAQIKRPTAERILKQVLQRAREINEAGPVSARIESIDVFGSYLTEADKLSDIDIIVRLPELDPYGPESDSDQQWATLERLKVSRYVSIHIEGDSIASSSCRRQVFP